MGDWEAMRGAMAVVKGRRVAGEKNCRTIEPTIVYLESVVVIIGC